MYNKNRETLEAYVLGDDFKYFQNLKYLPLSVYPSNIQSALVVYCFSGKAKLNVYDDSHWIQPQELIILLPGQFVSFTEASDDFLTTTLVVSPTMFSDALSGVILPAANGAKVRPGAFDKIEGIEYFDKVIAIDQSPIGRTPRSNPATYTGVFTAIRDLFAATPDAKERGYKSGRFSFNVAGGRCENCSGDGIIKIEMHFLPDIYVPCEVCHGKRYNRETLQVKYKGKSISDVLEMTVDEAVEFFASLPSIYNKIKTLQDVGLGYIRLGQSSTTLSGGEAQRVKLATELSKRPTGKTLYILDEPTTGLHSYDVQKLCAILSRLREGGNTVIVIEHNLDVIKTADYIVDMGPEGGDGGGTVVAAGTPEEVDLVPESRTGVFLKQILQA